MSRARTPTDNPIIESLNGWIKEELYKDFKIYSKENINISLKHLNLVKTLLTQLFESHSHFSKL